MDIAKGLLLNIGLLFGFLFLLNLSNVTGTNKPLVKKLVQGLIFGIAVVVVIMNAWEMEPGAIFDTRTVILSVVALLFPIETAIASLILPIAYRIFIGGIGVYAGILSMCSSVLIGVIWRHFVFKKTKLPLFFDLLIFGVVIHISMLLSQLAFPYPTNIEVIQKIWPVIIFAFPIAVVLVALSIIKQDEKDLLHQNLLYSENRYETIFNEIPYGLFQYDNDSVVRMANATSLQFLRMTEEELIGFNMLENVENKRIIDVIQDSLNGKTATFIGHYESVITHHKLYTRAQFTPLIVNGHQAGGIAMVEDLTESIKNREKIEELTRFDSLTRMLNRQSFYSDLLDEKTNKRMPISLGVIHINTFQIINDSLGYEFGNHILISVADCINRHIKKKITPYRISGDEFALIMDNTESEDCHILMNDIKQEIHNINQFDFTVTVSVGCYTLTDMNGDLNTIFNNAILEMRKNQIYDESSITKKTIDIIMTTLFDKSKRELKHSVRVGEIAKMIAEQMNLGTSFINKTYLAGKLHDIGKINIDEKILDKPGRLNDDEWKKIKKHPESGFKILSSVPEYLEIAAIILSHHERYDGFGYPNQMKGNDIPLPSRIIAIADSYDAMTEERTYRKAFTKDEAIEEIKRCKGSQFDPEIADIFLEHVVNKI